MRLLVEISESLTSLWFLFTEAIHLITAQAFESYCQDAKEAPPLVKV